MSKPIVVTRKIRSLGYPPMETKVTFSPFTDLPNGLVQIEAKVNNEIHAIVMTFDSGQVKLIQYDENEWRPFDHPTKSDFYYPRNRNLWPAWIVPVIFNTVGVLNSRGAFLVFKTSRCHNMRQTEDHAYALHFYRETPQSND